MMIVFLFFFMIDFTPVEQLIVEDRFLDAGKLLREQGLDEPESLRRFTTLLTEYYSQQIGFRTFFLKNLNVGDYLAHLRSNRTPLKISRAVSLIEENLETLLINAKKKYPGDPEIDFAIASYVFRGRCCFLGPKLKMSPTEALNIFAEARGRGLETSTSLLALALNEIRQKYLDQDKVSRLFAAAFKLNRHDPDILSGHITEMLHRQRFQETTVLARALFEMAPSLAVRVDALTASARAEYGLKNWDRALASIRGGLKINPQYDFIWMIGLDCWRKKDEYAEYAAFIHSFIGQNPSAPEPFQSYIKYLGTRAIHPFDERFIGEYRELSLEEPLSRVIHAANLGTYFLFMKNGSEAQAWFEKAHKTADSIDAPPKGMKEFLIRFLELARRLPR